MEESAWYKDFDSLFFEDNYLHSLKPFEVTLAPTAPNVGRHTRAVPWAIKDFLAHYFLEIVKKPNLLTSDDINNSEHYPRFRAIFYFLWLHLLRFQEIYWDKSYSFNISQEMFYGRSSSDLSKHIEAMKSFCIINLGDESIPISPDLQVEKGELGIIMNSPLVYPDHFDARPFVCVDCF